jgi:integrase
MAKKRTTGEGTIYKTERGKFRAQLVVGGRRRSKTTNTAKECRDWLREQRQLKKTGSVLDDGDRFLSKVLDEWFVSKQGSIQPATRNIYSTLIELHLKPTFGDIKIKDLSPAVIQGVVDAYVQQDNWTKYIRLGFTTFRNVLKKYVNMGALEYNPFDRVDLYPASSKGASSNGPNIWNTNQIMVYIATIDSYNPRPGNALKFAIGTGVRLGELLGLTWQNVDFDNSVVNIVQQMMPRDNDTPRRPGQLKSSASRRSLKIGDFLVDVLRKQWTLLDTIKTQGTENWIEHDLVFPSKGGLSFSRTGMRHAHYSTIRRAGLPRIRFHDLRHTAISLMLQQNVPITEVSRYAGHANVAVTLRVYSHFIPTQESKAAMVMNNILNG